MEEVKVIIPIENYFLLEYTRDNLPAIACVNNGLREFEGKSVFQWNLSLIITLNREKNICKLIIFRVN